MRITEPDFRWRGSALLAVFACSLAAICVSSDPGVQAQTRDVVLRQSAPLAVFPLDEARVNKGETTIEVRIVRQDNPDRADFSVALMLAACHGGNETQTAPVGSLGVYPAGQNEGSYAFDLAPALKQMRDFPLHEVCIKLALKPMQASAGWKRLRVTVTPPEWKQPPEK